ncbi:MAG TPA: serine/threonine-protein kinase, partial [Pyrinomonadaceae bacterium]|nr:serine/threonine-protein kinase [Pyrinomonadaceae bacterium]
MNFAEISGQTLDGKYKIERELGRGGMGTVYLATHLGTERPVAVKVIAPQFMERPEFVERFRREARAAGRLRHPNVVDVTDFGFSDTRDGRVAYLVMEYLDGCTLGEILEEEKNLPVSWTLDILEQVCSAVQEAHEQGIIHRDLKPDNIWLEPNQRGGYTVKVLDFGIAKLEAQVPYDQNARQMPYVATTPTMAHGGRATLADVGHSSTVSEIGSDTKVSDAATVIQESGAAADRSTVIMPGNGGDQETIGTQILSDADNSLAQPRSFYNAAVPLQTVSNDSELTRVGAVLGTPLYMSPEQCRGEHLDPRSDVYSLGVIAFQMLAGDTPFKGNFSEVMDAHREIEPPSLDAKKVRKKLKRVIASALSKNPDERPQTAEAFASMLVSRSEGIFGLLRRAGMIYTEHMPKFVGLAILLYIPFIAA